MSGEMLGTLNVPNGEGMARPPPSFRRSGWPGTAWQEEHPPALNVVRPLARFGAWAASRGDRQPPEDADSSGGSQNESKEYSPPHSPIRHYQSEFHG
jgi:hypothetical protein